MLQVCSRLVRDFASSESSTLRLAYVDACGHLFDPAPPCGCSRDFVKAHHLHSALQMLATDPVPNVRFTTVVALGKGAEFANDEDVRVVIRPALERVLAEDTDDDVKFFAEQALKKLGT